MSDPKPKGSEEDTQEVPIPENGSEGVPGASPQVLRQSYIAKWDTGEYDAAGEPIMEPVEIDFVPLGPALDPESNYRHTLDAAVFVWHAQEGGDPNLTLILNCGDFITFNASVLAQVIAEAMRCNPISAKVNEWDIPDLVTEIPEAVRSGKE